MSDQGIFDTTTQTPTGETTPTQSDPFADQLLGIKNENGEPKYKTTEDALKALAHSQEHIKKIEAEKAEETRLRLAAEQEANTRKSIEEVVQGLTTPQAPPPTPVVTPQGEDKGLSEDKVKELLLETLTQNQLVEKQTSNYNTVVKTLSDTYGDKANETIVNRAKELNTTPAALKELAKDNPQMVISLFQDVKVQSSSPVTSSTIPPTKAPESGELAAPEKKLITGAVSTNDVISEWRRVQEHVHNKLGVEK